MTCPPCSEGKMKLNDTGRIEEGQMSSIPAAAKMRRFAKSSVINTSIDRMMAFHTDPLALPKLTPPPVAMRVVRDTRSSLTEGEVEFRMWLGPLPLRWIARHEPGPSIHSFADTQVSGPLAYWRHEHILREVEGGVELTDRITFAHQKGWRGLLTRLAFDGLPLRLLFEYRHWRTRRETAQR